MVMIFDENTRLRCNHDRALMPVFEKYMMPIFMKQFEENAEDIQH
jgi:hypothetical protein